MFSGCTEFARSRFTEILSLRFHSRDESESGNLLNPFPTYLTFATSTDNPLTVSELSDPPLRQKQRDGPGMAETAFLGGPKRFCSAPQRMLGILDRLAGFPNRFPAVAVPRKPYSFHAANLVW